MGDIVQDFVKDGYGFRMEVDQHGRTKAELLKIPEDEDLGWAEQFGEVPEVVLEVEHESDPIAAVRELHEQWQNLEDEEEE